MPPSPPRIGTELPQGTPSSSYQGCALHWKAATSPTLSACVWFPVDILYCFNMFLNVSKTENLHNLLDHFPWERRNCKCQLTANEDQALLREADFTGWTSAGHGSEAGQLVSPRGRGLSPRICVSLSSINFQPLRLNSKNYGFQGHFGPLVNQLKQCYPCVGCPADCDQISTESKHWKECFIQTHRFRGLNLGSLGSVSRLV